MLSQTRGVGTVEWGEREREWESILGTMLTGCLDVGEGDIGRHCSCSG